MRCPSCGTPGVLTRICRTCGYENRVEWFEWVLLLIVFGGLVMGWYYEVL